LKASIVLFFFLIGSLAIACYLLRNEIGRIFTKDVEVLEVVSDTMPYLALNYFVGCFSLAGVNILEGMSRNKVLLIIATVGMWGICIPLFFYLTFYCPYFLKHGQLKGAWTANAASEVFKCVIIWFVIFRSDLEKLSKEAKERSEAEVCTVKEEKNYRVTSGGGQIGPAISTQNPALQSP